MAQLQLPYIHTESAACRLVQLVAEVRLVQLVAEVVQMFILLDTSRNPHMKHANLLW